MYNSSPKQSLKAAHYWQACGSRRCNSLMQFLIQKIQNGAGIRFGIQNKVQSMDETDQEHNPWQKWRMSTPGTSQVAVFT